MEADLVLSQRFGSLFCLLALSIGLRDKEGVALKKIQKALKKKTRPKMSGVPDQLIIGNADSYVHFLICYKHGHTEFDGGMIRQVPRYLMRMHHGGLFVPKARPLIQVYSSIFSCLLLFSLRARSERSPNGGRSI